MLLVGYAAGVLGAKLHEKSLALSKALTELDLYSKNLEHKNSELEDQKAQIQEMYSMISSQLNELTRKNQELNEAHLELKKAQVQLQDYAQNLEEKVAEQTRKLEEQMNLLVQMEKMAAMGNLVATVSHNVGNKVGAASTFVSFVVEGVESLEKQLFEKFDPTEARGILKQVKEDLSTYKEALDKVVEMVKNMKEFVRMGHEGEEVDLCRSINVTAKILDYDFIGDRVQLKRDFEPEAPPTRGMMGLINDVFMNLFLNARDAIHKRREQLGVKYSMEFPGEIDVKVRRNGTHVQVIVKDNGCGMPMEYIEKIKKGFFTSKPLGTGTGLGVRFCREVVEKYGGRVEIESQIDAGTTFILWFPIHPNHLNPDPTI
jgi:signal transduction histidine kinase